MTHKLKAFGFVLITTLVVGVLVSSTALAVTEFHSELNKAVLTGEATPLAKHPELTQSEHKAYTSLNHTERTEFTHTTHTTYTTDTTTYQWEVPGLFSFGCKDSSYQGTINGKTTSELTVVPSAYSYCKISEYTFHIDMNGCHYAYFLKEGTTEAEGGGVHTHGPMQIKCPEGKSITTTVTIFGSTACTIHIPEQTPTQPIVDYSNQAAGTTRDFELISTASGFIFEFIKNNGFCFSESFIGHDGVLRSNITLRGYVDEATEAEPFKHGAQDAIWVQ